MLSRIAGSSYDTSRPRVDVALNRSGIVSRPLAGFDTVTVPEVHPARQRRVGLVGLGHGRRGVAKLVGLAAGGFDLTTEKRLGRERHQGTGQRFAVERHLAADRREPRLHRLPGPDPFGDLLGRYAAVAVGIEPGERRLQRRRSIEFSAGDPAVAVGVVGRERLGGGSGRVDRRLPNPSWSAAAAGEQGRHACRARC